MKDRNIITWLKSCPANLQGEASATLTLRLPIADWVQLGQVAAAQRVTIEEKAAELIASEALSDQWNDIQPEAAR
jgi:hypothetical protein